MLILTLQRTQLNLAHRTHLLQDTSETSLLETQSDTLECDSDRPIQYVKNTVSKLSSLDSHTNPI